MAFLSDVFCIRTLGHLCTAALAVSALLSAFAYLRSAYIGKKTPKAARKWIRYAHRTSLIHLIALGATIAILYLLIFSHRFEYHYAWRHALRALPTHFKIACLWEGQEGSFLLWMFWIALIGLYIKGTKQTWKNEILGILSGAQALFATMILGIYIGSIKIGHSPFLLLSEVSADPIFDIHPDYVPPDGNGLNPLLQNIWMVIHPPVLFAGFALLMMPTAYAWAGLWNNDRQKWPILALSWMRIGVGVLGLGIMMGAYWAYETLNFGGYWNWDPVENAVYIPWLVAVAALHSLLICRKQKKALKTSYLLINLAFAFVLYASFLTRSGILGDTSVHAFTDLGLGGQLLFLLALSIGMAIYTFIRAQKYLRSKRQIPTTSSTPFALWMQIGIGVLLLMTLQVLLPTSLPVFNKIAALFGAKANWAPPPDPIHFYSSYQWGFALIILLLAAVTQLLLLPKPKKYVVKPLVIALIAASLCALILPLKRMDVVVSLFVGLFALGANIRSLIHWQRLKSSATGGAVAHIGIAILFLGILFSSTNQHITSQNYTGMIWHQAFPEDVNRDNMLLFQGEERTLISGDRMTYKGIHYALQGIPFYVPEDLMIPINDKEIVLKRTLQDQHKRYAKEGDTLRLKHMHKKYFAIRYQTPNNRTQWLYPRVYAQAEQRLYEPYIKHQWHQDLYVHVRTYSEELAWREGDTLEVKVGDTFIVNDYVAKLTSVASVSKVARVPLSKNEAAIQAHIDLLGKNQTLYVCKPVLILHQHQLGRLPDQITELGIRLRLLALDPDEKTFTIAVETAQKPWVIVEAKEKPAMNLLWSGVIIMLIGMAIAHTPKKSYQLKAQKNVSQKR